MGTYFWTIFDKDIKKTSITLGNLFFLKYNIAEKKLYKPMGNPIDTIYEIKKVSYLENDSSVEIHLFVK